MSNAESARMGNEKTRTPGNGFIGTRAARIRPLLDVPLVRNAYSLIGATLATSALGLAFWIVAARTYSTNTVGTNAALISTMTLLSSCAQLNLANGFNRFVPTSGSGTRRLVLTGYALALVVAVVAGVVFLAGVHIWTPDLAFLRDHPGQSFWFVGAILVWTIFALQDGVLTGLGSAPLILVENAVYGVIKLFALVAIASLMPTFGVFAAWTMPLVLFVVAINGVIFKRLLPQRDYPPLETVDARGVVRYVGLDFVALILANATTGIVTLVVLGVLGAQANAYVYLSWTIAYSLQLVSTNVGMAFVTEASREPQHLASHARRALGHTMRIVSVLAVLVAIGAPLVLRLFGAGYASNATVLLQLLALSTIPFAVVMIYLSIARVRRRMNAIITVAVVQFVGVVGMTALLLRPVGIAAVGIAWLVTEVVLATFVLLGDLKIVWVPGLRGRHLGPTVDRTRAVMRDRRGNRGPDPARVVAATGLADAGWTAEHVLRRRDDAIVVAVRGRDGRNAVLHAATADNGDLRIARRRAALEHVARTVPPVLLGIAPTRLDAGRAARLWMLESRCPGTDGRSAIGADGGPGRLVRDTLEAMTRVSEATRRSVVVDDAAFSLLVDRSAHATDLAQPGHLHGEPESATMERVRAMLWSELGGRRFTHSTVHGDLWLGNVLWDPRRGRCTGVVDWRATEQSFPVIDAAHLVCSTRALAERRELGDVVRDVLERDEWLPGDDELIASVPGARELSARVAILLVWLDHVGRNLAGYPTLRSNSLWLAYNVHHVLERL